MRFIPAFASSLAFATALVCLPSPVFADLAPVSESAAPSAPAFEQMLAHVYEDNPQLRAERDNLRVLDERVSESTAGFRPTLAFTGEIGYAQVKEEEQAWVSGQDRNLALVATQPLYNDATIGQWHAAKKRVLEGRARLIATEQKTLMTAITAWLDMCEKNQLLVLNRDNNRLTQDYLRETKQRQALGDGTTTDIAVAESRAADGVTRYAMSQSAFDSARATFERATGLHAQSGELPAIPPNLPASEEEAAALSQENPEIEQAGYEVAATDDDIDAANGAREPYIFLRGTVSDEHAQELGLSNLRGDSITINASIPLYQGGIEYARIREARIAHEKSRYDAVTAARSVREEAQEAWTRFTAALSIDTAAHDASESSLRALKGIDEEQKHGTRTLTEVLDAQAQNLNAQITELQARTQSRLEAFRLLASVGRLTAKGLNLPTTYYDPVAHYDEVAARWFGTTVADQAAGYDK